MTNLEALIKSGQLSELLDLILDDDDLGLCKFLGISETSSPEEINNKLSEFLHSSPEDTDI